VNAFLNSSFIALSWGTWLMSASELFLMICWGGRREAFSRCRYHVSFILLAPLTVAAAMLGSGSYGYYLGQFHSCFPTYALKIDWVWWTFCLVYSGTGGILAIIAIGITGYNMHHELQKRNIWKLKIICGKLRMMRVSILFIFAAFIWVAIISAHRFLIAMHPEYLYPDEEWTRCVFAHFDALVGDASWISSCGTHGKKRIWFPLVCLTVLCEYGNGIFLSGIYLGGTPSLIPQWKGWIAAL
jgi:hypothetical protein